MIVEVDYEYKKCDSSLGWAFDTILESVRADNPNIGIDKILFNTHLHEFTIWFTNGKVRGYTLDSLVELYVIPTRALASIRRSMMRS